MFKPGEVAVVRVDSRRVTVLPTLAEVDRQWSVNTSEGVFEETALMPACPRALATAAGRDWSQDLLREDLEARSTSADDLPGGVCDDLEEVLRGATFDPSGHWRGGSILDADHKVLDRLFLGRDAASLADAEAVIAASRAGVPLGRWVLVSASLMALRTCPYCGEEDFALETDGQVVRLAGDPCPFTGGLPRTEWELNVPSGELVVANDLRDLFPLLADDFDITLAGCRKTTLAYAECGLAHAYVGNTCPGVYRCADGTFKIANPPADEEWDGKRYVQVSPAPAFDGERVAGVTTDLWWYSVCDRAEFLRRCARFGRKPEGFRVKVVSVRPGVYHFSHDEEARQVEVGERVYSRFAWVREPDEAADLLARYDAARVTPAAYVRAQAARWPTLYGKVVRRAGKEWAIPWAEMPEEDRLCAWQRVADHLFCTIGGGVEWHERGFPRAAVDSGTPDEESPSFRAQHAWYPFSRGYGGLFRQGPLAPDFARLAFRVLESVISFGAAVRDGERCREVPHARERMRLAVCRYRELAEQHPAEADPDYTAWLAQEGRAEAWVEGFDLGPTFTDRHIEHARRQQWVPKGTYAIVFDADSLHEGHFVGRSGCWSSKADAARYALLVWEDNGQAPEHNCCWTHGAGRAAPLRFVARVVGLGQVSHMGETLVELAFDYGTPWMRDPGARKALAEQKERAAIRPISREEYERILPETVAAYEAEKVGRKS